MSKKKEEYPIFSEIKLNEIPEDAVVREIPGTSGLKPNIYAIAAFVLAILGIFPCFIILSAPVSLVGFIFAIMALCQKTAKKGFAISGLIINFITLVCSILFMCFSTVVAKGLFTTVIEYFQSMF